MKKVKFSGTKKFLHGKGYLIALLLCLSAVGVSTYLAYNQAIGKIADDKGDVTDKVVFQEEQPVGKNEQSIPKNKEEAAQNKEENEPANNFIAPPQRIMPIENSEVINPFSNGELIKSKTLGIWKTHDGIDVKADVGTEVKAMAKGKVKEVINDPLWGICVIIDHEDGMISHYYNLSQNVPVKIDEIVETGQVIGTVGQTADVESKEEPHLHFGIQKNEIWIDPLSVVK